MKGETKTFRIKLTSPMLGTVPKSKEVYAKYIQGKARDLAEEDREEELETVEDIEAKGWTGFHQDEEGLFLFDYMIRGFIKAAWEVCQEVGSVKKVLAYKKWIDNLVFVHPRRIHLGIMEPDEILERPLRTMTMQGPRVTISRSDYVNEGREIEFDVEILPNTKGIDHTAVAEVFEFGRLVGVGQWRGSGGFGQFEILSISDNGKAVINKVRDGNAQSGEAMA
jgi:hypothetical protein